MPTFSSTKGLDGDTFRKVSRYILIVLLVVCTAVVLAGAALSTTVQIVILGTIVGSLILPVLARDEVHLLCAILLGFVVVVRYAEGFQVEEVLYGLLYLAYLGYWFVSRLFFYRDAILRSAFDWSLFLFLIYVTLSLSMTPIHGGDMQAAVSEWLSLSMLAFYFPIREVCVRYRDRMPQKPILLSLGGVSLFIALRNFFEYRRALTEAEQLYQIATGRVVMNEHVLLVAGITTLVFLLHANGWIRRAVLTIVFVIFAAGIVIGQSRAVWLSFLLGAVIIFIFVDRKRKLQLVGLALLGLSAIVAIALAFFPDIFSLLVAGLTDRLFSLRNAATADISLVNRFIEMGAAWEYILANPIVGYGLGVPYQYYSLVYEATWRTSYVHNMYVGVIYRHGLIGFGLLFFFYFGSVILAFRTIRSCVSNNLDRIISVAGIAFLLAEALVGNAANAFATSDTTLIIAAMTALISASSRRTGWDEPVPEK